MAPADVQYKISKLMNIRSTGDLNIENIPFGAFIPDAVVIDGAHGVQAELSDRQAASVSTSNFILFLRTTNDN